LQAWLFGDQHHLPKRCIHADTKPTNVLFHPTASQAVAVIDLDMIAPYYLYYDFADGVRSTANAADESGSNAHIDLALLRAFAQGFLEPLHDLLTRGEKESLVRTLPCVSFMLTVRFATDYCENDRYFRVDDAEHNVRRAEAQYRITEDLMRSDVLKCVREICF
jgi:Ser/Thr protein kinase RdoA (MazF antagonist)